MLGLFSIRYSFAPKALFRVYRGHLIPLPPKYSVIKYFTQQYNRNNPNQLKQLQASNRWGRLTKQQKESYRKQAVQMHFKEVEEYQNKYINKLRPKVSAFALFIKCQNYEEMKKDNPGITLPDLTRMVSQKWKMLPPEQREKYKDTRAQPDLKSLREHKIPQLKISNNKDQEDIRIQKNIQQIREFCNRHNISIDELYFFINQSYSKRSKKSNQAKKKAQESSSSSSSSSQDGPDNQQ